MKFIADLHVHSRFSRATARNLDLEHLYIAAQMKGITVVGTGDFTHPGWLAELVEKLVPAEPGLFRLADELAASCDQQVPASCRRSVRFMLSTEISNIYKKDDRTRKNHNLIFLPDLDSVGRIIEALEKIGNLHSDGRPILGLDSRDLLEIVLETADQGFLVPAHIWTPWFSLLGSKSGFDSVDQCFADLSDHIFALETGLSSDPPMNWRVSQLDGRTLISNSDAHSPQKLGREANLFDTDLAYAAIRSALQSGDPKRFLGTIEFYPEEGKYHLDGHRKCGLRIHPRETYEMDGNCPVCNRPLTLGVLNRVEQLADRTEGYLPETHHQYVHLIPLVEVLADLFGVGPGTKKVLSAYNQLLEKFGSEDFILRCIDTSDLERSSGIPLLAEAILRVREKRIEVLAGYDGEFGRIRIFDPNERNTLGGQQALFAATEKPKQKIGTGGPHLQEKKRGNKAGSRSRLSIKKQTPAASTHPSLADNLLDSLNADQRQAVVHTAGPLLIVAGPGTGKTRTLTHRIAHLICHRHIDPSQILAITFTQKAAREMHERLRSLLGDSFSLPMVATFHSFCLQMLKDCADGKPFRVIDEQEQLEWIRKAALLAGDESIDTRSKLIGLADRISNAKQQLHTANDAANFQGQPDDVFTDIYRRYQHLLQIQHLYDYEDLIVNGVRLLENEGEKFKQRFAHVLVDEYQDLNSGQYRLLKALVDSGAALFAIGDPDQAIYGFRGSDVRFFNRFLQDFSGAESVRLHTNYRSSQAILDASHQVISAAAADANRRRIYSGIGGVPTVGIVEAASEKAEAVAVGKSIERLIGGMGFFSIDFGLVDGRIETRNFGFADIAVLFRTARQGDLLAEKLTAANIPSQLTTARELKRNKGQQVLLSVWRLLENVGSYFDLESAAALLSRETEPDDIAQLVNWGIDHNCSIDQLLEKVKRFPIPGLEKQGQRNMYELIRKLDAIRDELNGRPLREKLTILLQKLSLADLDQTEKTLEELVGFMQAAGCAEPNSVDLISSAALQTDTDRYNPRVEKVALLTMHAAKGLEFPIVFVTGCEEELIPFRRPKGTANNLDEERRLFYVAMTRAKELLFLTYCRKRQIYGRVQSRQPSPFLVDIENRLKSYDKSSVKPPAKKRSEQRQLF